MNLLSNIFFFTLRLSAGIFIDKKDIEQAKDLMNSLKLFNLVRLRNQIHVKG